jgi:hypothetical protein
MILIRTTVEDFLFLNVYPVNLGRYTHKKGTDKAEINAYDYIQLLPNILKEWETLDYSDLF